MRTYVRSSRELANAHKDLPCAPLRSLALSFCSPRAPGSSFEPKQLDSEFGLGKPDPYFLFIFSNF